jgi:hypothetical protein
MISHSSAVWRAVWTAVYLALFYGVSFWRILRRNPGNKLIECGTLTVVVFLAMVPVSTIPGFTNWVPDWAFGLWILLTILLCFSTLFFLAQRIFQAARKHKNG